MRKIIEIPGWINDQIVDIHDHCKETENEIIVMALIYFIGNLDPDKDKNEKAEENKNIHKFCQDIKSGRYKF